MLSDYIQNKRPLLEKHINDFLEEKKHTAPVGLDTYAEALTHLQFMTPRGKMLRGTQVLLAYEMISSKDSRTVLDAAAAIEIMQSAILIHDDFMDNDFTRRGVRSVFGQYSDLGKIKHTADPLLYGQSLAVCVGDLGFFAAYELLSRSTSDSKAMQRINELFSREWQIVAAGQMMDVDFASRNYEPTVEEILTVYTYKTARYSFSLPLSMGALLADADTLILQQLDKLGEKLGILFQIKDDELGLFGDEKKTGKPVGSDIRENKKTLLRAFLMKKASVKEKQILKRIFGNKKITQKEIEYVRTLINDHGIKADIEKQTSVLNDEIKAHINSLPVDKKYQKLLEELVPLITHRVN